MHLDAAATLGPTTDPPQPDAILGGDIRVYGQGAAAIAYRDTGAAWVAAAGPRTARAAAACHAFVAAAARAGRRSCFFGLDTATLAACGLRGTAIGREPYWRPEAWPDTVRQHRRLREQLRRARRKQVRVRQVSAAEITVGTLERRRLEAVTADWLQQRPMPAMDFLVRPTPFERGSVRRYWIAEQNGRVQQLLVACPLLDGEGWLVEHLHRRPSAPNGTAQLLIDRFMRWANEVGAPQVSLGLAPLDGEVPWPLRLARQLGQPWYNFTGVAQFKARLHPHRWQPRYLGRTPECSAPRAMLDVLTAFTSRGLLPFALQHFTTKNMAGSLKLVR